MIPTPRTLKEIVAQLRNLHKALREVSRCPRCESCASVADDPYMTAALDDAIALLAAEGRDERMQEKDHGAGLIHQPIPDVEGTEPRPIEDEDHVCGGCGKLNEDCDCDYPHDAV